MTRQGGRGISDRLFASTASRLLPSAGEITIRNALDADVSYWVQLADGEAEPTEHLIVPGAVDRYPDCGHLIVAFDAGDGEILRRIVPGQPYAFRRGADETIELYLASHGRTDAPDLAPFVATPLPVVRKMLELAEVGAADHIVDIGCGDGRIVIVAALERGARGVGIDLDPQRIAESRANAQRAGLLERVEFRLADATKVDVSSATVVACYLLPQSLELLRPSLEKQLRPGTRVVTHGYAVPGWDGRLVGEASVPDEDGEAHFVYLYRL